MIPSAADRQPIELDPYDSDLADLLALVRAVRDDDTAVAAYLLASGREWSLLITAAKLLAVITLDAASADPREMAAHLLEEAAIRDAAGWDGGPAELRRFDQDFAQLAARAMARE